MRVVTKSVFEVSIVIPPTTTIVTPTLQLPRLGDFESKALVHAFNPVPTDVSYGVSPFNLVESDLWPYGAARTASGKWYGYFRSVNGLMTTGAWILCQDSGAVLFDSRSADLYAGTLTRSTTEDADRYHALDPADDVFSLSAGTTLSWTDPPHLDLTGVIAGPGLQLLTTWREPDGVLAHHMHSHLGYEVRG